MNLELKIASIVKFIIYYSLIANFLVLTAGLPSMLMYLNDLLTMMLLICVLCALARGTKLSVPRPVMSVIGILLIVVLCAYALNLYSPLLLVWGLRNNFRAIVFFVACCMFLEKKDVNGVCNFLLALLPINMLLCTVQYIQAINSTDAIVLEFINDHVGGIFGNQRGCNRMLNIYITFVFSWIFAQFLQKKCSRKKATWIFICCIYMSLLSGLKVVVIEFTVVMVLLIWWVRRKVNRALLLLLGTVVLVSAISIVRVIDPSALGIFESLDMFIDYASASSYGESSLNRLTAVPYIQERFFAGDILKTLFGVGLGNADSSNFAFLTSSNYLHYGYLKYYYFMSAYLYFEIGLLGLVMYLLIFIVLYICYARKLSRKKDADPLEYAGVVFNVIAILCVFYNTSLRSEVSCYMAFFFLAIPIILDNRCSEPEDSYLYSKQRRLVVHW